MGIFRKSNKEQYISSRVKSNSIKRKLSNKNLSTKQREKLLVKKDKADAEKAVAWANLNDRSTKINQTYINDSFKSDKSKRTNVSVKLSNRSKRFK